MAQHLPEGTVRLVLTGGKNSNPKSTATIGISCLLRWRIIDVMTLSQQEVTSPLLSPIMWLPLSDLCWQSLRENQLAKNCGLASTSQRIKNRTQQRGLELRDQNSITSTAHPFDNSKLILALLQTVACSLSNNKNMDTYAETFHIRLRTRRGKQLNSTWV